MSSAGAVGLSQLMPSTAASVAQKLRIVDPDLRDPATNLAIGVRHLKDLLGSTGSMTKALLAYNAGLTRLRQWERAGPGLPADLFVESAAIAETRGYVRKILVSSVMYAFLYRDTDPRDAALSFFSLTGRQLEP
jgi:soluble lytic murein transglycosylase